MRRGWSTSAIALMHVLAVGLPFESKRALLNVGPIGITNVELILYLLVLCWGGALAMQATRPVPAGVSAAVLAWGMAHLVSAAVCDDLRAVAFKFALRTLGGCLLFFCVASLVDSEPTARSVAGLIALGSIVSACLALAHEASGASALFTTGAVGGPLVPRAPGTFGYPTLAAMYWEGTFALVLASIANSSVIGKQVRVWAPTAGGLVLTAAIVLTGSRAALVVEALVLVACIALVRPPDGLLRRAAAACLVALGVFIATAVLVRPAAWAALLPTRDLAWYSAEYVSDLSARKVEAGRREAVHVRARNVGSLRWQALGPNRTWLGYEWRDTAGRVVATDKGAALPRDVPLGGEVEVVVPLLPPADPGHYTLRWQLGTDVMAWTSPEPAESPVDVGASVAPRGLETPSARRLSQRQVTRLELWKTALRIFRGHPWTGVGPDNFRHVYERHLGALSLDDRIQANSLYVGTLAELGILGALALIGLAVALSGACVRAWRSRIAPSERVLTAALLCGLGAFFLHGIVDSFLAFTPTYGLFWMLGGLVVARSAPGGGVNLPR